MLLLARLIRLVAMVVCTILVVAIVLFVLNVDFNALHDAGKWLAGPFKGLIDIDDAKLRLAVNWGLAALVYAIVAGILIRLIAGADGYGRGRPTVA
ncbi:MAG: hypothetical protein ACJ762_03905 [Solirubrobacteraceae bacterium]